MARKPTGNPRGRPRSLESTPQIERRRERSRRWAAGLPPLPPLPRQHSPDASKERNKQMRQQRIDMIAAYKLAKQCTDCDRVFTKSWHLDLDHLPGAVKKFNLSKPGGRSWNTIMDEIDKCEVVCALCHRDRTMSRKDTNDDYGKHTRGTPSEGEQGTLWEGA